MIAPAFCELLGDFTASTNLLIMLEKVELLPHFDLWTLQVMIMEQYASIGKLVLKNAIGLQRNRKEISYETVTQLDEQASGCFECPYYSQKKFYEHDQNSNEYLAACSACLQCKHRFEKQVVVEKVKYINESNRYASKIGYSETLKANGLKLLIVLHMMHPNRHGFIFDLSISELKSILQCDRKTVISNLEYLQDYDYITFVKTNQRGHINVSITGYDSYFKSAREGGRGYMTFSIKLVEALLAIKDLTTLRLFLHQLIDTDNYSDTEKQVFTKSYHDLCDCLPSYYKPNHVKKGLSNNLDNPIFTLDVGRNVTFVLNPDYNAKKVKEQLINDSNKKITDYIEDLNDHFDQINEGTAKPEELLPEFFFKDRNYKHYITYIVQKNDIYDLAKMSWQFSLYDIIDALDYIYINYVMTRRMVDNLPGLVRTLIPEIQASRSLSSLAA